MVKFQGRNNEGGLDLPDENVMIQGSDQNYQFLPHSQPLSHHVT